MTDTKPPREPSGRPLLLGAFALVIVAILALVALLPGRSPPSQERAARPPAASVPPVAVPAEPAAAPSAAPAAPSGISGAAPGAIPGEPTPVPAADLFATPDLPELVAMSHQIVQRGGMLAVGKMKEIHQYAVDHPGDARPHLVLGADAMNRGWLAFAVDHYLHAAKEDPRAREDPRMLADLASVAGSEHNAPRGADAITRVYGRSAITAIQAAASEASDRGESGRAQRLTDLLGTLEGLPAEPAASPP